MVLRTTVPKSFAMSAFFGWIDYSEKERRRMLDTLSLLKQQGILDELGIGTVRDALADLLFPGTSTIQTRPRYFLIIPWIYERVERKGWKGKSAGAVARDVETRVTESLRRGPDTSGVIGVDAGPALIRPASEIYWQGLRRWGIRLFDGSRDRYHRWLDQRQIRGAVTSELTATDDGEPTLTALPRWHWSLPPAPSSFPDLEGLALTGPEAEYLRERILTASPNSLLAALIRDEAPIEGTNFPWDVPGKPSWPKLVTAHVELAKHFSETMHGAALIYNLMLARETRNDDLIQVYQTALSDWSLLVQSEAKAFRDWDQSALLVALSSIGRVPSAHALKFVGDWHRLVSGRVEGSMSPATLADDAKVHGLIKEREWQMKGRRARLGNPERLASWSGISGASQLDFRWRIVQSHVRDLLDGARAGA